MHKTKSNLSFAYFIKCEARKKKTREKHGGREKFGEMSFLFSRPSRLQISPGHFFLTTVFSVTLEGSGKRGTTHSIRTDCMHFLRLVQVKLKWQIVVFRD